MKKIIFSLLAALFLTLGSARVAFAGTDLTITCANEGPCSITPASTPLFNETNLAPGNTRSQHLTIVNNDSDDTCNLLMTLTDKTTGQPANLANRMFAAITSGSTNYIGALNGAGTQAVAGTTYQTLYNTPNLSLGSLAPNSSRTYTWFATFDPSAGNEYQGVQTVFDFGINITCAGGSTSSSSSSSSGGGSSFGPTSPASAPVCNDTAPSSAPVVSITNVGTNTVTLSWTSVSPVSHYALFFTRVSDGAQYGASDIGNVTSYTITNLSGGASYSFQVMGVNGCAPGPRSNTVTTNQNVGGGVITTRPIGNGGLVLGVTTAQGTGGTASNSGELASPSPEATPSAGTTQGQVAGITTAVCSGWRQYIPWILLVIQFILIMFFEYRYRHDSGWTKHILALLVTGLSIFLFYLLRQCSCYGPWTWLGWLCKWYWLVSLILTLLLKAFSYAFLDESSEKEQKPKSPTSTTKPVVKSTEKPAEKPVAKPSDSKPSSPVSTEVATGQAHPSTPPSQGPGPSPDSSTST